MAELRREGTFLVIDYGETTKYFPSDLLDIEVRGNTILIHGTYQGHNNRAKILDTDYTDITGDKISGSTPEGVAASIAILLGGGTTQPITFADTPAVDAFARLRISESFTLFDSKQIHDNKPLFWDDQEVSGSGTTSSYVANQAADKMTVGATTAGKLVRQTFQRFNYQSGKSQLIVLTFSIDSLDSGITKEVGYFDDNNGVFLRSDGSTLSFIMRSNVTGTPVDSLITQSNWNIDKFDGTGPSGVTLDFTKTQILIIDMEWLGVGRVRYGFYHNGVPLYAHYMQHSNVFDTVYMSTPNLPVRYSIENDGTGAESDLFHLCSTVISEGGQQHSGILRYASTEGTHIDANSADTLYAVIGIRLKAETLDGVVNEVAMSMLSETNANFEWVIVLNPEVAGTFTYSDQTNSIVQVAMGATANIVTNGTVMTGGWGEARATVGEILPNAINIGSTISGTPDTLVLCVRPLSANLDIQAGLTWRELS